jgi:hypothetical protein
MQIYMLGFFGKAKIHFFGIGFAYMFISLKI